MSLNPSNVTSVADAVWDEARADHVAAGSFGLNPSNVTSGHVATTTTADTSFAIDTADAPIAFESADNVQMFTDGLVEAPEPDTFYCAHCYTEWAPDSETCRRCGFNPSAVNIQAMQNPRLPKQSEVAHSVDCDTGHPAGFPCNQVAATNRVKAAPKIHVNSKPEGRPVWVNGSGPPVNDRLRWFESAKDTITDLFDDAALGAQDLVDDTRVVASGYARRLWQRLASPARWLAGRPSQDDKLALIRARHAAKIAHDNPRLDPAAVVVAIDNNHDFVGASRWTRKEMQVAYAPIFRQETKRYRRYGWGFALVSFLTVLACCAGCVSSEVRETAEVLVRALGEHERNALELNEYVAERQTSGITSASMPAVAVLTSALCNTAASARNAAQAVREAAKK